MRILSLEQGSDAWLSHRAETLNASEAPAMLGLSPYMTRAELLRLKHDGVWPEVDAAKQRRFDDGHRAEAAARPIAEGIIGSELYPATVTDDDGRLSASLDGMTMDQKVLFEHKLFNGQKAEQVERGECPESDYPQVQQQLLITGAEKCLYVISDGTKDTLVSCWVYPDAEYQQKIRAGWDQFEADLADYTPPAPEPEAVGVKMGDLPALLVEVEGKVVATNIEQYRDHALAVFGSINTDLQTDQDFADAEETVKWCKDIESQLDYAKKQALAQTASIDDLFRAVDEIKESARQKRLELDRLVKSRKEQRRSEIVQQAISALHDHYRTINETLNVELSVPAAFGADVAGAMKGKRTIKSLIDAADQALTDAKLDANSQADRYRLCLQKYTEHVGDYAHLFPDRESLVLSKAPDDLEALIKTRIAEYEQLQAVKREAERKLAEAEAERKLAEAEAERKAAEEDRKANQQAQAAKKRAPEDQPDDVWRIELDVRMSPGMDADQVIEAVRESVQMNYAVAVISARLTSTMTIRKESS